MSNEVVSIEKHLPEPVARRGITEPQWRTLANNLFPGADVNSVLMVWDYCVARKLDPLKKPCHIVPMSVKDAKSNQYVWRDVVMPGIYEYRTTAMRTGLYLGHTKPEYGPTGPYKSIAAPEWCEMTMRRWNPVSEQVIEFPVRVYFRECVGTDKEGKVNGRWTKAPIQMLTKVCEAAGLREAFPDEFGGEQTFEELDGQTHPEERTVIQGTTRAEQARDALKRTAPTGNKIEGEATPLNESKAEVKPEPKVESATKSSSKVEPKKDAELTPDELAIDSIARLQTAKTVKDLRVKWDKVIDDYTFRDLAVPQNVEDAFHDMKEKLK